MVGGESYAHRLHPLRRRPLSSSRRRGAAKSTKFYSATKVSSLVKLQMPDITKKNITPLIKIHVVLSVYTVSILCCFLFYY